MRSFKNLSRILNFSSLSNSLKKTAKSATPLCLLFMLSYHWINAIKKSIPNNFCIIFVIRIIFHEQIKRTSLSFPLYNTVIPPCTFSTNKLDIILKFLHLKLYNCIIIHLFSYQILPFSSIQYLCFSGISSVKIPDTFLSSHLEQTLQTIPVQHNDINTRFSKSIKTDGLYANLSL